MSTLGEIEKITKDYSDITAKLSALVAEMEEKIGKVKKEYIPKISELARKAAEEKALLKTAIEESPHLFQKPKTIVLYGVKLGFQKKKGKLIVLNPKATLKRIKEQLPDKADVLIKVEEKLVKNALNNLTADELKKIGVEIQADSDEVIIKSTMDEIEKFINSLIDEEVKFQIGG